MNALLANHTTVGVKSFFELKDLYEISFNKDGKLKILNIEEKNTKTSELKKLFMLKISDLKENSDHLTGIQIKEMDGGVNFPGKVDTIVTGGNPTIFDIRNIIEGASQNETEISAQIKELEEMLNHIKDYENKNK